MEEVAGRTRALSLADASIGVLASRPGGATTIFGKFIGKAFLWYRQRRGLGGSRGFALCAVPLPFLPLLARLRASEPRTPGAGHPGAR